jgi:hypothetical protein
VANKKPTLHDSILTKAFLQAHTSQRNDILNLRPDDPLATPGNSIHLILAGLPEHVSEFKLLKKEFNKKKKVTVITIEELHTEVPALECASASAAGAHPRFKGRRQGERSARRIFHQPPGNPKLQYNCQYCLADGHKEEVCFKEKNGTYGKFSRRTSPSAGAVDVAPPAQDMSQISSAAKSIATSIQNLRTLLSGTAVNSADYTAYQVQVPPRPVLDSAASHSMCCEEKEMTTYRPAQVAIRLANQTTTKAIGAGTALIPTGSTLIKVPHALHVPSMHGTLVAVSQLAKQGTLMFTGSQFWYTNRMAPPTAGDVIARGETVNGVYLFEEPDEASAAAAIRSRARNSFNVP